MNRLDEGTDILRLVASRLDISQPERVVRLLEGETPNDIAVGAGGELPPEVEQFKRLIRGLDDSGLGYSTILEDEYPHLLREVREAPAIIYWEGTPIPDEVGVSIVGSREASQQILGATYDLAYALGKKGIPVISGLARGVDTAAHKGALDAGGRTIAVLGCAIDATYPAENRELRKEIAESGGLVLSQFGPGEPTRKYNFPMRNAVMSGYGAATVVLAAGEHSGTKHQVKAAVKHGRAVIFTGTVANYVSWANELVSSGRAAVARSLDEALEVIEAVRSERAVGLRGF